MVRITTSLVIPAFNEEKYIGKLLDTVLQQTHPPDEVIVVNNASTDKTAEIVASYQHQLPLKLYFQPLKGITPAVVMGFAHARGDIILKTDADCLLPKKWVESHLRHFLSDPSLVACGGFFLENHTRHLSLPFMALLYPLLAIVSVISHGHPQLYGGNLSIRRRVYLQVGGYDYAPGHSLVDDQRLSQKLFRNHLRFTSFSDCYCFTSARRFRNPFEIILGLLSTVNDKMYHEKAI